MTPIPPVAAAGTAAIRPSPASLRRRSKFQLLVAEFALRDLDAVAVAEFLDCSTTAAHQFVNILLGAAVIEPYRASKATGSFMRRGYRLNSNAAVISGFWPTWRRRSSAASFRNTARSRPNRPISRIACHFHLLVGERNEGVLAHRKPVQRDPLVAALFGASRG